MYKAFSCDTDMHWHSTLRLVGVTDITVKGLFLRSILTLSNFLGSVKHSLGLSATITSLKLFLFRSP